MDILQAHPLRPFLSFPIINSPIYTDVGDRDWPVSV